MLATRTLLPLILAFLSPAAHAGTVDTSAGALSINRVIGGLEEPWAIAFLPDGTALITERGGRLLGFADGVTQPIAGVPDVQAEGQGGLLDVMVPADFDRTREVW
ncbi:MAG: PQQ-dependent sugar dehydrogenase, partial [Tabrizicola sp.]